jgi:hypothetical protein
MGGSGFNLGCPEVLNAVTQIPERTAGVVRSNMLRPHFAHPYPITNNYRYSSLSCPSEAGSLHKVRHLVNLRFIPVSKWDTLKLGNASETRHVVPINTILLFYKSLPIVKLILM